MFENRIVLHFCQFWIRQTGHKSAKENLNFEQNEQKKFHKNPSFQNFQSIPFFIEFSTETTTDFSSFIFSNVLELENNFNPKLRCLMLSWYRFRLYNTSYSAYCVPNIKCIIYSWVLDCFKQIVKLKVWLRAQSNNGKKSIKLHLSYNKKIFSHTTTSFFDKWKNQPPTPPLNSPLEEGFKVVFTCSMSRKGNVWDILSITIVCSIPILYRFFAYSYSKLTFSTAQQEKEWHNRGRKVRPSIRGRWLTNF